jgi:hypothetical protein
MRLPGAAERANVVSVVNSSLHPASQPFHLAVSGSVHGYALAQSVHFAIARAALRQPADVTVAGRMQCHPQREPVGRRGDTRGIRFAGHREFDARPGSRPR